MWRERVRKSFEQLVETHLLHDSDIETAGSEDLNQIIEQERR